MQNLKSFLSDWVEKLERLKGHVLLDDDRILSLSIASGIIETKILNNYSGPTEIIAMGFDFSLHEFNKSFKEYTGK
jgi:hypothetical protein